jgi:hypothetical protein
MNHAVQVLAPQRNGRVRRVSGCRRWRARATVAVASSVAANRYMSATLRRPGIGTGEDHR